MNEHNREFEAHETRKFEALPAVRSAVPLLIGLMGPSGSGKTFSALRLATGIQTVTGGDVYAIDTEARRMLHYADNFKFKHISFAAPFGALDYLAALQFAAKNGGKVIIVDSMSHEHEGPGGLLDTWEKEMDRLSGGDDKKRERVRALAMQRPKADRRRLINTLLQMEANFVFCFRAKEKIKMAKVSGKTEVIPQGFMPIAGDEFVYEQTINFLLLPGAKGVPTWTSEFIGERQMTKLPDQFRSLFVGDEQKALDESLGRAMALWAKGGAAPISHDMDDDEEESFADRVNRIDKNLAAAAEQGWGALKAVWDPLPEFVKEQLRKSLNEKYKPRAREVSKPAREKVA